ncbi:hypothetical protein KFE25_008095 [Diacronema lutheri]|uniref:Uncharacterized protein n=1 Tax=Diacronema lutheri TaxID=2081491 RepID=A0A8J6CD32_DIALT|nr:hypothetical protein KFE25_008095 [Diacronema lutheri]
MAWRSVVAAAALVACCALSPVGSAAPPRPRALDRNAPRARAGAAADRPALRRVAAARPQARRRAGAAEPASDALVRSGIAPPPPSRAAVATPIIDEADERLQPIGFARTQQLPVLEPDMGLGPRFDDFTKLLSVCTILGLAAYRFFSVDADLSRGWTAFEVMQRLLPDNWNEYETALKSDPVLTKTTINTVIYTLADWLAQVLEGRKPLEFDERRLLRSAAIGLIFGPITCAYYEWSDHILDPYVVSNRPLKILMDQSVYAASKYTMFVALRELFSGTEPAEAVGVARKSTWPLLKRGWRFWPAVHMVTYSVIPPRHRVLWVNCADLVWVTILSLFKAQEDAKAAALALPKQLVAPSRQPPGEI